MDNVIPLCANGVEPVTSAIDAMLISDAEEPVMCTCNSVATLAYIEEGEALADALSSTLPLNVMDGPVASSVDVSVYTHELESLNSLVADGMMVMSVV